MVSQRYSINGSVASPLLMPPCKQVYTAACASVLLQVKAKQGEHLHSPIVVVVVSAIVIAIAQVDTHVAIRMRM